MTEKLLQVVEKACAKDERAFTKLCEMKTKDILYVCRREMKNAQDAEDAAQEVLIFMHRDISTLQTPAFFNTWLTRLSINTCRQMRRKTMRHDDNTPIEDINEALLVDTLDVLPQSYIEDAELRKRVIDSVDRLREDHRQCIVLFYFNQLKYEEIAEALEITPAKVKHNLIRARKILKLELEDESKTKMWTASPLLAIGPALHKLFTEDMAATVTTANAKAVIEAAGIKGAFSAASAIGAVASALGIAHGIKGVLQIIAILTAVGVGGGVVAYTVKEAIDPSLPPASHAPADEGYLPRDEHIITEGAQWGDEDPALITAHAISGRVYLEDSGVVDPHTRTGLAGVTVELVNAETNEVVETTTTDSGTSSGRFYLYTFDPGDYKIRVILPDGAEPASAGSYETDSGQAVWLQQNGRSTITFAEEDEPQEVTGLDLALSYENSITGRVTVAAGETELLHLLPTTTVALTDPQGRVVATASVNANGSYTFQNPVISQSGTYTLTFSIDNQVGLHLPFDSYSVQLTPGESKTIPTHTMTDTSPPLIEVNLTGGDCECGHLNPTGIEITTSDITSVTISWTISIEDTGAHVTSGTSSADLNATMQGLQSGTYLIVITATDAAGNTASAEQVISKP